MKAYVLVNAAVSKADSIQEDLRTVKLDGLELIAVDPVAGPYDLVVIAEAEDPQRVGELVVTVIQRLDGVLSTVTLLHLG